jgi:hypothetical protein
MYYEIKNAAEFRERKQDWENAYARDLQYRERGINRWTGAAKAKVAAEGVLVLYTMKQIRRGYPLDKCHEALEHPELLRALSKALYYEKDMTDAFMSTLAKLN